MVTSSKVLAFNKICTDQFDKCGEFPHLPQNVADCTIIAKEQDDHIKGGGEGKVSCITTITFLLRSHNCLNSFLSAAPNKLQLST